MKAWVEGKGGENNGENLCWGWSVGAVGNEKI